MLKATAAKATGPTYVKTLLVVDMVLVDFLKIKVHIRISGGLSIFGIFLKLKLERSL